MKVFIERENKQLVLDKGCKGIELLRELKINPETVILVKNNEVILSNEELKKSDNVIILSVISGG